ncbi:seryl-tRNA synthetase, partial [Brucella abortus BC95]
MRRRHLPTLITTLPPPDLTSGIFGAEDRLASLLSNFTKWLFSMLDIKWIRENPETLDKALAKRGAAPLSSELIALDEKRREHVGKVQAAQERRNAASKEIGKAMAAKDMGTAEKLKAEVGELKDFLAH